MANLDEGRWVPENKEILKEQERLLKFIEAKDGWNIEHKIERILQEFKLKEYENRPICSLSGGEIRRVALGALILKKPDVLLLDEPTNSLDNTVESKLKANLKVNTVNKTMILVTHRTSMLDLVDRLIVMDNGKILLDGPRDEVLARLSGK